MKEKNGFSKISSSGSGTFALGFYEFYHVGSNYIY